MPETFGKLKDQQHCAHDYKQEYYGWQCVHCNLFYPYGCEPWNADPTEQPRDTPLDEIFNSDD